MKFFKRSDVLIICALLILSLGFRLVYDHLSRDKSAKAEIYYYSTLVKTVELKSGEDKEFSIPQNPNVVFRLDKEGHIAFVASDCPDKVCIKTGKLHRIGEYAACLPNGIIIKIVPEGERGDEDLDIIVGN